VLRTRPGPWQTKTSIAAAAINWLDDASTLESAAQSVAAPAFTTRHAGVGRPAARQASLAATLSIPNRDAFDPDPTNRSLRFLQDFLKLS